MQKKGRLELTWVGKYDVQELEPRILVEDKSKSYGDDSTGCMLIHGDNLLALRALENEYAGKIKCIYIDPPYNTGSAFEQYDDNLEHSEWLNLMCPRLEILWKLLSDEGSIWISIDDDERDYLKLLCDEIFGRKFFLTSIVWQKRYSRENREAIGDSHEYILIYVKDKDKFKKNRNFLQLTEKQKKAYKNPDNDPRGAWQSVSLLAQGYRPNQMYTIVAPNGKIHNPPAGNCWKVVEAEFQKELMDNRITFGADGNGVPRRKMFLNEAKGLVPWTWWPQEEVGHTGESKNEVNDLFGSVSFDTPKPERLIERIIHIASKPGDIILDSFLGSGTTAAVAHKMGRRWIGIEFGEHCYTHCKIRMDKVIDGEQGGISKAVNWKGGGGYKFYELAEPLLVKNPKLPIYQINPSYTFDMVAEAICKIEGFTYAPQGEFHGYSSENRFIHVTMEFVNTKYIQSVMKNLGERQSLLIYCKRMQNDMNLPVNVEVRRIPKDLLKKCSFEGVLE